MVNKTLVLPRKFKKIKNRTLPTTVNKMFVFWSKLRKKNNYIHLFSTYYTVNQSLNSGDKRPLKWAESYIIIIPWKHPILESYLGTGMMLCCTSCTLLLVVYVNFIPSHGNEDNVINVNCVLYNLYTNHDGGSKKNSIPFTGYFYNSFRCASFFPDWYNFMNF